MSCWLCFPARCQPLEAADPVFPALPLDPLWNLDSESVNKWGEDEYRCMGSASKGETQKVEKGL